jgi:hypothetical protein
MKHIKKFTESNGPNTPYTWDELVYRVKTGECKLTPSKYYPMDVVISEEVEALGRVMSQMTDRDPDINTSPIVDPNSIVDGLGEIPGRVVVFDNELAPVAIITEYDMMSPFVFDNIVIVPGRDAITCYNKSTGEFKRNKIR